VCRLSRRDGLRGGSAGGVDSWTSGRLASGVGVAGHPDLRLSLAFLCCRRRCGNGWPSRSGCGCLRNDGGGSDGCRCGGTRSRHSRRQSRRRKSERLRRLGPHLLQRRPRRGGTCSRLSWSTGRLLLLGEHGRCSARAGVHGGRKRVICWGRWWRCFNGEWIDGRAVFPLGKCLGFWWFDWSFLRLSRFSWFGRQCAGVETRIPRWHPTLVVLSHEGCRIPRGDLSMGW
jgi:hypothetical protein